MRLYSTTDERVSRPLERHKSEGWTGSDTAICTELLRIVSWPEILGCALRVWTLRVPGCLCRGSIPSYFPSPFNGIRWILISMLLHIIVPERRVYKHSIYTGLQSAWSLCIYCSVWLHWDDARCWWCCMTDEVDGANITDMSWIVQWLPCSSVHVQDDREK